MPVQVERSAGVELWPVGGVEIRPTRVMLWLGPRRRLLRVVPLGGVPDPDARPLRERVYRIGPLSARRFGSTGVTLAAASTRAIGRLARPAAGSRVSG